MVHPADDPCAASPPGREILRIPAWATAKATAASPIYVVDPTKGWGAATNTGDGVHPNPTGSQKMVDAMSAAIGPHL